MATSRSKMGIVGQPDDAHGPGAELPHDAKRPMVFKGDDSF